MTWGCHNRDPLKDTVVVQQGWTEYYYDPRLRTATRQPVMVELADPMTKDCQYTLSAPADPRCTGCRWQRAPG